jgi:voltage-gated potassium channel
VKSAGLLRYQAIVQRWRSRLRLELWFPHVPLALLLVLGGALLLDVQFAGHWDDYAHMLVSNRRGLNPALLPPLMIGGGMLLMAVGLLFRSRLAWVITLLLVAIASVSVSTESHGGTLLSYFLFVLAALFLFWKHFNRSSAIAGSLFALTAVLTLLGYSTFGAYYLGQEFQPAIKDLVTALYFSVVTMSTVGYGDITPQTVDAKLFTISIVVLGLTVFATALTAVIAPLVSHSLSRIVNHRGTRMKRENHFVVIGNTSLAVNAARALHRRGQAVTRLLRDEPEEKVPGLDLVIGEPSAVDSLREAGVEDARAVLAMTADDSDNAFVVLAVRELASRVETVVAVNDASHLDRIKLVQPNVIIAPQVLGGELTAMLLSGETVTPEFVMEHVFQRLTQKQGA